MNPGLQGHLAMLLFSGLVAGSFALGSLMADQVDPTAFNAMRFAVSAVCIFALARIMGVWCRAALRAPWRYAVLGGLFGFYFAMMFEGLKTAPPVSAAAVFTLVPVMAAGFAFVLLGQRLTARMAVALIIGGAGALWVIFRADVAALLAFDVGRGEAIYFIGCVAHGLYTPLLRKLNRGEHVVMFTFGTVVGGAVLLGGWSAPEILRTDWLALPGIVWITLFYVAVFATAGSVLCLQFATLRLPAAKVMAYTYLIPSWVIVWQIALGRGAPAALVLGGVALTVLALALLLRDEGS
ncbi:MAG: DMT family transporter [Pseudomonadota bacterium]